MKHRQRERKLKFSLRVRVPSSRRSVLRTSLAGFIAVSTLSTLNAALAVGSEQPQLNDSVGYRAASAGNMQSGNLTNDAPRSDAVQVEVAQQESSEETPTVHAFGDTTGMSSSDTNAPSPDGDSQPNIEAEHQHTLGGDGPKGQESPPSDQQRPASSPSSSGYSGLYHARHLANISNIPPDPQALPAVFATGGRGRFKEMIQWLQWADYDTHFRNNSRPNVPILRKGQSPVVIKNYRDYGQAGHLLTECQLSDLEHHSRKDGVSAAQAEGPLVATIPGTWAGDVLDNLYNVGGPGQWESGGEVRSGSERYPDNYTNKNHMVIGLANGYAYNGDGSRAGQSSYQTGFSSEVSFDVHCKASLVAPNGTSTPVQLTGLVFADAEASSAATVGRDGLPERDEWVQAYAWESGTRWRVLETLRSDHCPTFTRGSYLDRDLNSTQLMRLIPNGEECVYQNGGDYTTPSGIGGPGAVTFMEGSAGATIRMQGSGYSAVALGLVIASDFGDAPQSYGIAGSLFQPSWTGGQPPNNTTHEAHTGIDIVTMTKASAGAGVTHLGSRIDAEQNHVHDSHAMADDQTGSVPSDEDALDAEALRTSGIRVNLDEAYRMTVPCRGPGKVAGWIDWNRDGNFRTSNERSTVVACTGSEVTLEWKVPVTAKRSVAGEPKSKTNTFMRLRIADVQNDKDMLPTGVTTAGEVEDYEIKVYAPTVELNKIVQAPWGLSFPAEWWKLTGKASSGSGTGRAIQETKYNVEWGVVTDDFTLGETTDLPAGPAFEAGPWVCTEAPGTINPPGYSFSSTVENIDGKGILRIKGPDRIFCEITNTTKPGSVSWQKTNKANGQHVGGSVWSLKRSGTAFAINVTDCESGTCTGHDKDNRPGYFKVTPLRWGDYILQEVSPPAGFLKDTKEHRLPRMLRGVVDVELPTPIPNTPIDTAVVWRKVDASTDARILSGSQWRWQRQGGTAVAVSDCTASQASGCTGEDKDHRAGYFRILIREPGTYTLTETVAPLGYQLNTQSITRSISRQTLGTQIDLGAIQNMQVALPHLPLTGGASADAFLFVGFGILGVAVITALYRRRQATL